MDIPEENARKWFQSDVKMKIIQAICECLPDPDRWSISVNRPNLNIQTGYAGDSVIEITFNHPVYGEMKFSGKNFL